MKKTFENLSKGQRQEKVSNRLTICVSIAAALAFLIFLLARWTSFGGAPFANEHATAGYIILTIVSVLSLIGLITLYTLSNLDKTKCQNSKLTSLKYKERFRNYAHMCTGIFAITTYISFNFLTRKIGFLSAEHLPWIKEFKNVSKAITVSYWLIGMFIVAAIIYHFYLYYKNDTKKKAK